MPSGRPLAPAPSFTAERTKTKAQLLAASDTLGIIVSTTFAGPCTRSRLAWQMLAHSMDSYGQMAVYLRLNGIVPPASRGA